eukprot:22670_1
MSQSECVQNISLAANFLVGLLKKNWQNVGTLVIKSTMGPAIPIFAWELGGFPATIKHLIIKTQIRSDSFGELHRVVCTKPGWISLSCALVRIRTVRPNQKRPLMDTHRGFNAHDSFSSCITTTSYWLHSILDKRRVCHFLRPTGGWVVPTATLRGTNKQMCILVTWWSQQSETWTLQDSMARGCANSRLG